MSDEAEGPDELPPVSETPAPPVDRAAAGQAMLNKGMAYLQGVGETADPGMAAASFLDGADLGHPESTLMVALMYYTGTGVTRNLESSRQYATQFQGIATSRAHLTVAQEIISESLGSENARRLLFGEATSAAIVSKAKAAKSGNRGLLLFGAVGVALVIGVAAFGLLSKAPPVASLGETDNDVAALIPAGEQQQAQSQALAIAAKLRSVGEEEEKQIEASEQPTAVAQNTADANNAASPETASAASAAAPQSAENAAAARTLEYFTVWSALDNPDGLANRRYYAESVNYYGSVITLDQVMAKMISIGHRWPTRQYVPRPSSLSATCTSGQVCTVQGILDWSASSQARAAHSAGVAQFTFEYRNGLIDAEGGKILSRE